MVQGTVNQEDPTTRKTLRDESWDSTKEVLGQSSLGTVSGQCNTGTVLDQNSLDTVSRTRVLGQGLGTVV